FGEFCYASTVYLCPDTHRGGTGNLCVPERRKRHAPVFPSQHNSADVAVDRHCLRAGHAERLDRYRLPSPLLAARYGSPPEVSVRESPGFITPSYRSPSVCQGLPSPLRPSRILWNSGTMMNSARSPVFFRSSKSLSRSTSISGAVKCVT